MSYKKSNVTGGSSATPFNTPFFVRWGESSIKVPMARLLDEYNAWEKLQRRAEPELPKADPFPSFPSGPFDWAEDVEQELFSGGNDSDNTSSKPDSNLDTDDVDSPIVDQVVSEGVAVVGAGTTLCAIPEEDEEEDMTGEDEVADPDPTDPTDPTTSTTSTDSDSIPLTDSTTSTDIDNTVYRILNVSATGNDLSLHMVEDDTTSNTDTNDPTTAAKELFEAIQFLAGVGLLNLDTYATVFDTAARACAAGPPFWLNDPLGDRAIVVGAGL
ncbi:hypothetical protein LXA43DRAFT_1159315 [Ganoderma leucocontextum]|nr:hypothetical protein LXA43DRAFT_1159315 [Ganoderma leucocontextum]